ncbi:MAG: EAL and HDOD domain-containing protein [Planctomycetota bacterium]
MSVLVARQPILDQHFNTCAYELLFRSGVENCFSHDDGDQASLSVINNSFLGFDMQTITGGHRAFINCTRSLLLSDYLEVLPSDRVVLEVLETVTPDAEVIAAVERLKKSGFSIALDDFVYTPEWEPLIKMTDIIKMDFMESSREECKAMADAFLPRGVTMLAEKVECQQDVDDALGMGYNLLQGYFFCKPVLVETRRPTESKISKLRLLSEVNRSDFDIEKAEEIIKHDPTLAVKLLKYVNSAGFALRNEVKGIRQALALLGRKNLKRWVTVLLLSAAAEDKPSELMRQIVIRARFCELLARPTHHEEAEEELFMTGLFSLLDALMDQPMKALISDMNISSQVKDAVTGVSGPYHTLLEVTEACEHGAWDNLSKLADGLNLSESVIASLHQQAIEWADSISTNA